MDKFFIKLVNNKVSISQYDNKSLSILKREGEEEFKFDNTFWSWFKEKIDYDNEKLSFIIQTDLDNFKIDKDIKIANVLDKSFLNFLSVSDKKHKIISFPKVGEIVIKNDNSAIKECEREEKQSYVDICIEKTKEYIGDNCKLKIVKNNNPLQVKEDKKENKTKNIETKKINNDISEIEFYKPIFENGSLKDANLLAKEPIKASLFCQFLNEQNFKIEDNIVKNEKDEIILSFDNSNIKFENSYIPKEDNEDSFVRGVTFLGAEYFIEWLSQKDNENYQILTIIDDFGEFSFDAILNLDDNEIYRQGIIFKIMKNKNEISEDYIENTTFRIMKIGE